MFAANSYTINGVDVTYESSSVTNNCWLYVQQIYKLIWETSLTCYRDTDDNILKNLSGSELDLTVDHLKKYIAAVKPGTAIRICPSDKVDKSDGEKGHSQLIVAKSDSGFTVLESNIGGKRQQHTYSFEEYVNYWNGRKHYGSIKYMKYPGATPYQPAGWVLDSNGWWYRNSDGSYPKANWAKIDGRWYHFDSHGYAQKGWYLDTDGSWYYLDPVNCWMLTGWQYDSSAKTWYYLNQDGRMACNTWHYDELYSAWYYLKPSGAMAAGETLMFGATPYTFDQSGKWIK